jgi:hypothetical protein
VDVERLEAEIATAARMHVTLNMGRKPTSEG